MSSYIGLRRANRRYCLAEGIMMATGIRPRNNRKPNKRTGHMRNTTHKPISFVK